MQSIQVDHTENSRLRFIFDDAVMSFDLVADATFGEVAQMLDDNQRYGQPIAIDIILNSCQRQSIQRALS